MYTAVNSGDRVVRIVTVGAEIHTGGLFAVSRNMYRMVDKLVYTFVFYGGNRHYGYSKYPFKIVYTDRTSVCLYLIHHIERKHHRYAKLHKLHCKIKVTLDIRSINYIYDTAEIIVQQKITGHYFFVRIRRKRIDAR